MPEYCVTGGTGFIAAYLVKALLDKGHVVRTTVRNPGIYICSYQLLPSISQFFYAYKRSSTVNEFKIEEKVIRTRVQYALANMTTLESSQNL